jgi:adenylosuccinate synthase
VTIYIVTDLGYGDSGKGTTVDFLARRGRSLVVRHNGGSQAGHNVVTPEGRHHEFSQWGSGHFAGADTFLSRFMLVHPGDMRMEAVDLQFPGDDDPWKRMYIDAQARIVTPFHVAFNRLKGYANGQSCGKGIGELMRQDIARPDLTIRVKDIPAGNDYGPSLARKIDALRNYLYSEAKGVYNADSSDWQLLANKGWCAHLADQYHDWRELVSVVDDGQEFLTKATEDYHNVIFEGAQGVLLDEWHGFHPYTTWSTTTHENALTLLNEAYQGPVARLGVTRAYATRHGAGPFVTENQFFHFDEPHNVTGPFQGAFRTGSLDLIALRYAIAVCGGVDGLVVTHLDRAERWNAATGYRLDGLMIRGIDSYPGHDLALQEKLTVSLMRVEPDYSITGTEGLLAMLNKIAPVMIESRGPTADDKQWTKQAVAVL